MDTEELNDYIDACRSQLDNVLSSPIGSGEYGLPSEEELDEMTFLEQEIEDAEDLTSYLSGEDNMMRDFFK